MINLSKIFIFLNNEINFLQVTRSITELSNLFGIAKIGSNAKTISPREPCLMINIF